MSFAYPPPRRVDTARDPTTKHVVLVEDNEAYRYSVERDLVLRGFVVHAFETGLQALDFVDDGGQMDALITDLALPPGTPNGLSLAHMMRRRRPGVPVAMMTAIRTSRSRSRAASASSSRNREA